MEQWADGELVEQEQFAHAIKQAAAIGQAKLLKDLWQLDMELFIKEIDDAEHIRVEAGGQSDTGPAA